MSMDIADIGFRIDTSQLDAAMKKMDQFTAGIKQAADSTDKVGERVGKLRDQVQSSSRSNVQAHLRTRKAIEDVMAATVAQTTRVDSATRSNVAAHRRTKLAVDEVAQAVQTLAERQESAATRNVNAQRRTREAIQQNTAVTLRAMQEQIASVDRLIRAVNRVPVATARAARGFQDMGTGVKGMGGALRQGTEAAALNRVQLLGLANAVAVLDGPLGGVASRISSLAVLLGRFTPAGAGAAIAVATLTKEVFGAASAFQEFETRMLRIERLLDNAGNRLSTTGQQITGIASMIAYDTLESVETVSDAIMGIIGIQVVNAENLERISRAAADGAAAGLGDIGSVANSLARALENPGRNLAALNRRFNIFSDAQINYIRLLNEMGRANEANDIILSRFEETFGGVAEQANKTTSAIDSISQSISTLRRMAGRGLDNVLGSELEQMATDLQRRERRSRDRAGELSPEEQLLLMDAEIRNVVRQISNAAASGASLDDLQEELQRYRDRRLSIEEEIERARVEAAEKAAEAEREANAAALDTARNTLGLLQERLGVNREQARLAEALNELGLEGRENEEEAVVLAKELLEIRKQERGLIAIDRGIDEIEDQIQANRELAAAFALAKESAEDLTDIEGFDRFERRILTMIAQAKSLGREYTDLEAVLQNYRDSVAELSAEQAPIDLATAESNVATALERQINLLERRNELAANGLEEDEARLLVQRMINETGADLLGITVDQVMENDSLLDRLREALRVQRSIAEEETRRRELTREINSINSQLDGLNAQLETTRRLGIQTEDNNREFRTMVQLYDVLNDEAGDFTEEQRAAARAALETARNVDSTTSALRAATQAANAFSSAMAQGAAQARSAQARAAGLRDTIAALRAGESEAIADAIGRQTQERVLRREQLEVSIEAQISAGLIDTSEAERVRREGLAEIESILKETFAADTVVIDLEEEKKILLDARREAMRGASGSGADPLAEVLRMREGIMQMAASLDESTAKAYALARQVETLDEALAAGAITTEEYMMVLQALGDAAVETDNKFEQFYQNMERLQDRELFQLGALENAHKALSDFLFDPFEKGVEGMVRQFAQAMARMAADAVAANIMQGVMGAFGMSPQAGGGGGAAALQSAGVTLNRSGFLLERSATALTTAAGRLSATSSAGVAGGGGDGFGSFLGIFAGMFDQGGYIPPGQVGIAGERGPELISGPANVTSRRETASVMSSQKPEVNQKIINVLDPSIVGQYLNTDEGEQIVLNILQENGVI